MRRAIVTKYLGYTNTLPSRIKAIGRARESYSDGTGYPGRGMTRP